MSQEAKAVEPVKIAVLMCTYNGEAHLLEQLESIAAQQNCQLDVWVSDDGSTDKTLAILNAFQSNWDRGRFTILSGPQKGFARNFISLICNEAIQADYYAFCDQDDIWMSDKLSRALSSIDKNIDRPSVYCSRTELIAENGEALNKQSSLYSRKPHFRNALIQSLAGANTMVMNHQTIQLLRKVGSVRVVSHDWWVYMIVSGVDGFIAYDSQPSIYYRQHEKNKVGANNTSIKAHLIRIKMLYSGIFRRWNSVNKQALVVARQYLHHEHQQTLDEFVELRKASFLKRILIAKKLKLFRQTFAGNLALIYATLFKKL